MKKRLRKKTCWMLAAAAFVGLSMAVYAACPQTLCAKSHTQCVQETAEPYAAKGHVSFTNGHAVLGLYDTQAAWEFLERQPLAITLQRQGQHIILPGLPEGIFDIENTTGMKPQKGDIALDIRHKNIVIFCRNEEPSADFIPIGHVIGGMKYLLQTEGTVEGYVTKHGKEEVHEETMYELR